MTIEKTAIENYIRLNKVTRASFAEEYPHLDKLIHPVDHISIENALDEIGVKTIDQTRPFYFIIKMKKLIIRWIKKFLIGF